MSDGTIPLIDVVAPPKITGMHALENVLSTSLYGPGPLYPPMQCD